MIKLLENSITKNKNVLNFVDQNGNVVGFDPNPNGFPISWRLFNRVGELEIPQDKILLADYLTDKPYYFLNVTTDKRRANPEGDKEEIMFIDLVPDEMLSREELLKNGGVPNLYILASFLPSAEFYTANLSFTEADKVKLFGEGKIGGDEFRKTNNFRNIDCGTCTKCRYCEFENNKYVCCYGDLVEHIPVGIWCVCDKFDRKYAIEE